MKRMLFTCTLTALTLSQALLAAPPEVIVDATKLTISAQPPLSEAATATNKGAELRFAISNTGFAPVTALMKVNGLVKDSYDIYSSGDYVGNFSKEKLSQGVPIKIAGGMLDEKTRHTVDTLIPLLSEASHIMIADPTNWPFPAEFRDAHSWARGISGQDLRSRTAFISLVEDGRAPEAPVTTAYVAPKDIVTSAKDLLADLERLRGDIQKYKMASDMKAKHFGWILPIRVDLQYQGDSHNACQVVITNYDSRTAKGTLEVSSASSQDAPQTCAFNLAPGKSVSCQLRSCDKALIGKMTGQAGEFRFSRAIDFARENSVSAEEDARKR